jgi:hypothetical protein
MKISDEKWHEIVEETRAGIERWNTRAREKQKSDQFHVEVTQAAAGKYEFIIARRKFRGVQSFTGKEARARGAHFVVEIKAPIIDGTDED